MIPRIPHLRTARRRRFDIFDILGRTYMGEEEYDRLYLDLLSSRICFRNGGQRVRDGSAGHVCRRESVYLSIHIRLPAYRRWMCDGANELLQQGLGPLFDKSVCFVHLFCGMSTLC